MVTYILGKVNDLPVQSLGLSWKLERNGSLAGPCPGWTTGRIGMLTDHIKVSQTFFALQSQRRVL